MKKNVQIQIYQNYMTFTPIPDKELKTLKMEKEK